ncbi:MAG: NUDIX domain-containing protein [Thainema sp.]
MYLSDIITPTTPSGTALFLTWQGYHVFSIPKREVLESPQRVRFCGVGGKRENPAESFSDCALRESREEIGDVVAHLNSAPQTYWLKSSGSLEQIDLQDEPIQPRFIFEKRRHSDHGSMADSNKAYYLVAFDATLIAQPQPRNEIAAIVYLMDQHLVHLKANPQLSVADLTNAGALINYQTNLKLEDSAVLVPHGTVHLLLACLS